MALKIVLLAGDGTGPEVMRQGVKVLKAVEARFGVSFDMVPFPCGGQHYLVAGDRLWRRIYDEVAAGYPGIARDYAYIDAFLQWIVRSPENYDVAVAPNEFGDIATDLAAVLQGGMGMAAGGN